MTLAAREHRTLSSKPSLKRNAPKHIRTGLFGYGRVAVSARLVLWVIVVVLFLGNPMMLLLMNDDNNTTTNNNNHSHEQEEDLRLSDPSGMAADHPNTTTPSPHNQQSLRNHNHSNGSSIVSHNKLSLPLLLERMLVPRENARHYIMDIEKCEYAKLRITHNVNSI
jgi:hypothetical protein